MGSTPLLLAVHHRHEAVVKLFLAQDGVDPNSENIWGKTPLLAATRSGYKGIVKPLLTKDGIDPDCRDNKRRTPLSWAAEMGREAIAKLPLAIDNVDPESADSQGFTPLMYAEVQGHEAIVGLLTIAISKRHRQSPSSNGSYLLPPVYRRTLDYSYASCNGVFTSSAHNLLFPVDQMCEPFRAAMISMLRCVAFNLRTPIIQWHSGGLI